MHSVLAIRAANPDDASAIAAFHTAVWREAYRGLVPDAYLDRVAEPERTVRWAGRLRSGNRRAFMAILCGRLVGVASVAERPDEEFGHLPPTPPLELKSLYVHVDHRGTGVAASLLDVTIGTRSAFLWVFDGNARARAFYLRHGFVADGAAKIDPDTGVAEIRMRR